MNGADAIALLADLEATERYAAERAKDDDQRRIVTAKADALKAAAGIFRARVQTEDTQKSGICDVCRGRLSG